MLGTAPNSGGAWLRGCTRLGSSVGQLQDDNGKPCRGEAVHRRKHPIAGQQGEASPEPKREAGDAAERLVPAEPSAIPPSGQDVVFGDCESGEATNE